MDCLVLSFHLLRMRLKDRYRRYFQLSVSMIMLESRLRYTSHVKDVLYNKSTCSLYLIRYRDFRSADFQFRSRNVKRYEFHIPFIQLH